MNTLGSFTCACRPGYAGGGTAGTCIDVDECTVGTHNCPRVDVVKCRNTEGSFLCQCNLGYSWNGSACADLNECATQYHNCGAHAECANVPGSFTCKCAAGWAADGTGCFELNECALSLHKCHAFATCSNIVGSYSCACIDGYVGSGQDCQPCGPDSFKLNATKCSSLSCPVTCSPGSVCSRNANYTCAPCPSGFFKVCLRLLLLLLSRKGGVLFNVR